MSVSFHPDLKSEVQIKVAEKGKKKFEELTFTEKKEVIIAVRKLVSERIRACDNKSLTDEEYVKWYHFAEQLDEALKDVNNVEPFGTADGVSQDARVNAYKLDERRDRHRDRHSPDD